MLANKLLNNKKLRDRSAENGFAEVIKNHICKIRVKQILEKIKQREVSKMEGKLLRLDGTPTVYILRGRSLRSIPDPQTLKSLGRDFSEVVSVDEEKFSKYRMGKPILSVKK